MDHSNSQDTPSPSPRGILASDRERDIEISTGDSLAAQTLQYWRESFSLSAQREAMESLCSEMRAQKTLSIAGRKRLNDRTKAFRAVSLSLSFSAEQSNAVFELLKAYQEEIDQLSKRAKLCESAYFAQYKLLSEALDPVPCIEGLLQHKENTSSSSLEILRLQRELSQYEQEFQTLRNQDVSLRRLEDELLTLRSEREEDIEREVNTRMVVLKQATEREIADTHAWAQATEKRCTQYQSELQLARQALDAAESRLFRAAEASEEKVSSLSAENAQLAEALQSTLSELSLVKNQLLALSQHAHTPHTPPLTPTASNSQPHSALLSDDERESALTQLRAEMLSLHETLHAERARCEAALRESERERVREREERERLCEELRQRPERSRYVALRQRLRTVLRVAFHCEREEDDDEKESCEDEDLGPESVLSDTLHLESLLSQKINTLNNELTAVRLALSESKINENEAQVALTQLRRECDTKTQRIAKLESDLDARTQALERLLQQPPVTARITQQQQQEAFTQDFSQLLGVSETSTHTFNGNSASAANANANTQMVNILQSQRDRLKEKLDQSEATTLRLQEQVESLEHAKNQLRAENVALFSKIKFLQMYGTKSNSNTGSYRDSRRMAQIEEGRQSEDDVEEKYRALYEQQMNPFAEFSMNEKQRKLRELSVADRIVLNTAMAVISNNTGRNVLMVYLGAMHLLVFFTIYYAAHNVHHGCDPALDLHSAAI